MKAQCFSVFFFFSVLCPLYYIFSYLSRINYLLVKHIQWQQILASSDLNIILEQFTYALEQSSNLLPCSFVCPSSYEFYGHAMLIHLHRQKSSTKGARCLSGLALSRLSNSEKLARFNFRPLHFMLLFSH